MALFARPRAMSASTSSSRAVSSVVALGAGAVAGDLAQDARGDRGVQQRLAAVGHADRAHELGRLDVLEQVAGGARAHRRQHLVLVEEARQDDHARGRRELAQALDRADAVELGHDEVHEHDVGLERGDRYERRSPSRGLADDLDVVLQLEERPSPWRTTAWSSTTRTLIMRARARSARAGRHLGRPITRAP